MTPTGNEMRRATLERIAAQRVIPVLRCSNVSDAVATARACARAGLSVVELTCSTPDVDSAIRCLAREGLIVGLGTITRADRVAAAVAAGVRFVVSFLTLEGLVEAAHEHGVVGIPGAMTPSEVEVCQRAGADVIKLFPAEQLSPSYLRHLGAVLPDVRFMPTGGIDPTPDSVCPWLSAGAIAVGIGGGLGTVAAIGEAQVQSRASRALAAAHAG